jgi:THO complex subunit 2
LFRKENFAQILGFKFQNHAKGLTGGAGAERTGTAAEKSGGQEEEGEAGGPAATGAGPAATTPASLYVLAATLIRAGVVELDALYAHLAPADDAAVEAHKAAVSLRLAAVRKIGVINLLAKASEDKDKAKEPDPLKVAATPVEDPGNQKLGLLRGFLAVGDLDGASTLIERLSALGLDPAEDGEVRAQLCAALRDAVAESYAHAAPAGCVAAFAGRGDKAGASPPDAKGRLMPTEVFKQLALIGRVGYHFSLIVSLQSKHGSIDGSRWGPCNHSGTRE